MLQVVNVCKTFESPSGETITVLKDICFSVKRGEFIALLGPSGCGKTTLLNIIGGLLKSDCGDVLLANMRLSEMSARQLDEFRNRYIGFIFQGTQLIQSVDALDNVLLPAMCSRTMKPSLKGFRNKASRLLADLGLEERMNYLPHQLSIGQNRRVAIARALINDPLMILADEPTSDLDPPRAKQIISILQALSTDGRILIAATHDMKVAEAAGHCYEFRDSTLVNENS
ncbi:MAG: ABC transporter ATP-binding protein [Spirochaetota bacterium]